MLIKFSCVISFIPIAKQRVLEITHIPVWVVGFVPVPPVPTNVAGFVTIVAGKVKIVFGLLSLQPLAPLEFVLIK